MVKVLQNPIKELVAYPEMETLLRNRKTVELTGCVDSQKLHMINGIGQQFPYKIIVTYSELKAKELYEEYTFYDNNVFYYPAKDLIFYQADIHGNQLITERMKCIRGILEANKITIITTFNSLMTPQIPLSTYQEHVISISLNQTIETNTIAQTLVAMGYEKNYQVEAAGQFSIRGGIIDIFDLTEENPYRIELWGEEVESIRSFDILSQRSIEKKDSITIFPATEMILSIEVIEKGFAEITKEASAIETLFRSQFKTQEAARIANTIKELKEQVLEYQSMINLESYIHYFYKNTVTFTKLFEKKNVCIFLDEPARIKEHASAVELEFRESMMHRGEKGYSLPKQMDLLRSVESTMAELENYPLVAISTMGFKKFPIKFPHRYDITVKSNAPYHNSFEALVKDLKRYKKNGFRVLLLSGSRTRAKRLAEDLLEQGLNSFYSEDPNRELIAGEIMTFYGHVKKGFEYPMLKFVVLAETDIFGSEKKKRKTKKYEGQKISDFKQLKVGDYVVHENHGLGIYKGIEKVEVDKITKDYIKIEYRGGGNLYILATGLGVIQKYASKDAGRTPKLNKLGSVEWSKTKAKVKGAVAEIAKDLVELYAIRQQQEGYPFSKDNIWQQEFEEMFPFEETGDQILAINATKQDMESYKIMDRLICGDVGYGKTEIAIRAAFKAVQDGKQVVYLVPTTILAQQHYNTFVQRMKDFPINIQLLCRFKTASEQRKIVEDVKKGQVDIVIGTHRVISKDVSFKSLGLLVIDEEQRFGVTHKEKIKKLKEDVDVLTLTATPIPRTLHMSLVGIRDMSVLEEAPHDRMPIQTYVMEYNEEMIREAIVRELSREGQVYYVYNRVNNIADITAMIQSLVPEANVGFAHGQMKESELEKIMFDFINGEIDVLVSTTIIETGLDISNVNTIIIHESDKLGLSQLYQLRGRVGRSNRTSYAFLMYKRDKILKEVAEKRLQAIKEFTELGSGFKIAMRDLEIRGAGNLLGSAQHGHMEAVGYDLYCKMLHDAVKKVKGIESKDDFNTLIDLDVDAFIPPSYILNELQKLDIYKRIASIDNHVECNDIREELQDRFGNVPKEVDNLLRISLLRIDAHQNYISEIKGKVEHITVTMCPTAPVQLNKIQPFVQQYKGTLSFQTKGVPTFALTYKKIGLVEQDKEKLMELTAQLIDQMKELFEL